MNAYSFVLSLLLGLTLFQSRVTVIIEVRSGNLPIQQVEVSIGEQISITDEKGEAVLQSNSGETNITVARFGYGTKTVRATILSTETTRVLVDIQPEVTHREEITVTATRTEKRVEDEPLRIEVIDQDEVDEKTMMTPGDVAMLLNETSGVRVQVTSPSLGAANVRIQGLRGRYTQLLADGLPLYGGQSGAIGLLQIPPLDLGQVEVLKGVASALYGSSAMGGVINLISRRPEGAERQLLLNQTSRGGSDSVFWLAQPAKDRWGYTILGGAHFQREKDTDNDSWSDMPGYRRAVLRPRFYWDNGSGRSLLATTGVMIENREGGSQDDRFPENIETRRFDGGLVGRFTIGKQLFSFRGSAMTQRHRHEFGNVVENDRHETFFGEAAISGQKARHTWVVGSAVQTDVYRSHEVPRFDYTYVAPGVFLQDDYAVNRRLTLSASGRFDTHNEYGGFFNPRVSALLRLRDGLVVRASTGTGVFVPTPFTEETEAIGLSRVSQLSGLQPERARSASGDIGWTGKNIDINASVFSSRVRNVLILAPSAMRTSQPLHIANASEPTRTAGSEFFARMHGGPFALALSHTFVRSTELSQELGRRAEVALTPKHTASVIGYWEVENKGRVGMEFFYTGRQRLEDNPYRDISNPYWLFGGLIERRFGSARVYINAENLANVQQSNFHALVRGERNFKGQWTVDQWAPLDGRTINAGVRFGF